MSYQLAEIKLQSTGHIATNTRPLVINLSPITGNDASFLRVSVKVSYFAGVGAAAFQLQQSHDCGVTWVNVLSQTADSIIGTGVFTVETNPATGILSPNVRVVITPDPGVDLALVKMWKTFSPGPIIPLATTGAATEITLLDVLAAVDGLEAGVGDLKATATDIKGDTAAILLAVDGIEASIDGVEAALAGIDASVDAVKTAVDAVDATLQNTNAGLGALNTSVDNIEAVILADVPAMKTQVDNIFLGIDAVEVSLADLNASANAIETYVADVPAMKAQVDAIFGAIDGVEATLTTLAGKDYATEATLQKIRKWPYTSFDTQVRTSGVGVETWAYKLGVATVGTVTINYTDATNSTIDNVVYNPPKVV